MECEGPSLGAPASGTSLPGLGDGKQLSQATVASPAAALCCSGGGVTLGPMPSPALSVGATPAATSWPGLPRLSLQPAELIGPGPGLQAPVAVCLGATLPVLHLSSGLTVAAVQALQELDGGLGSCQAGQDLSTLADPCPDQPLEDRARATPRLADSSSWSHDSQEPAAEGSPTGNVDARPKKTEKEPVTKVALGAGKERLKAGATPRSPARKKAQAAPPPQRPPPPPTPALSEELPWGDLSLNKCLVLASLLAMLGSAFQLCRDAVAGEAGTPAPVPEPWVPPRSAPEPASPRPPPPPKPEAWVPPSGPPAPQVEAEEKAEVPGSREAADKAAGEERAPKETPRKEERPRRERPRKEQRPPKERPRREERARKQEKPRAAREPRGALPRRWEAGEGGRRPWTQDSGDPGRRKRQAWGSPRRPDGDRPPGRQKQRAGKGRD
ncbi:junctional sarcoplasmic reticulum protein 1 isoform X2 [Acinonyx jubatus]|uniref:Junctional sarcoplasmic reticulum protein 1 isoform X2 n=1 Tax=Acinonyx jubatus TaxID=32536 RepID=A0A6J1YIQ1_ACIJB|nr:junctional sarcoplasmic reticulum protein 1 isoform X2 [Acinonyx jubatus]